MGLGSSTDLFLSCAGVQINRVPSVWEGTHFYLAFPSLLSRGGLGGDFRGESLTDFLPSKDISSA